MPPAVAAAIAAVGATVGGVTGAFLIMNATVLATLTIAAGSLALGSYQRRKAKAKARAAFNASLQDRLVMVSTAEGARSRCYGRVRNVDGVLFKATRGANKEFYTLFIAVAGHEIDGFEGVYFGDKLVTLDGNGYVQTEPYNLGRKTSKSQTIYTSGGAGTVTVAGVIVAGSASATQPATESTSETGLSVSVSGSVITVSGGVDGAPVTVSWQESASVSNARVRFYTGAPGQDLSTVLQPLFPSLITAGAHRFAGIAGLLVDLEYEPDSFPSGVPSISAVFRGARVFDPRTNTTAWTENPALIARDWALYANGGACSGADLTAASFDAAANACDTLQAYTTPSGTVSMPLYTCGIVIKTDDDPWSSFQEIVESMAGKAGWSGGQLRVVAGVYRAPVAAITEDWLSGKGDISIVPEPPTEEAVNVYRPTLADKAQAFVAVPGPEVRAATYITADGRELQREITLGGVTDTTRAQHVCGVLMRDLRNALSVTLPCNLRAFQLELFDTVTVTLPRFGWAAKEFEVVDWSFSLTGGVNLALKETAAAIYQPDSTFAVLDVTPNTQLPSVSSVPTLQGLQITTGTPELVDGGAVVRASVTWTAPADRAVSSSGAVEVQYWLAKQPSPAGDWNAAPPVPGNAASTTIPGLAAGSRYLFRARFVNALGVRGQWCVQVAHAIPALTPVEWAAIVGRPADSAILNTYVPAHRSYLNSDPACEKPALWETLGTATFGTTTSTGAQGQSVIIFPADTVDGRAFDVAKTPARSTDTYSLRARVLAAAGNNRNMYLVVRFFRANDQELDGSATGWGGTYSGYLYGAAPAPGAWVDVGADFGAGTPRAIPSDVAYMRVGVWGQYSDGTSSVQQMAQWVRLENVTETRAAQAAAAAAALAAGDAQTDADTANAAIADTAADGKLSPVEKQRDVLIWQAMQGEKAGIDARADAFGIVTEKTAYGTAYSALSSYVTPLLADLTVTSTIVGATYRANFLAVTNARQALLNRIAEVAGQRATWASVTGTGRPQDNATVGAPAGTLVGSTAATTVEANAANALANAAAAALAATNAQTDADTANEAIADTAADGKLSPVEKQRDVLIWQAMQGEKAGIDARADAFGIVTEKTAYGAAYSTLSSYVTPLLADLTVTSTIVGATYRANFLAVTNARQALLNRIAEVAGQRALTVYDSAGNPVVSESVNKWATGPGGYVNNDPFIERPTQWAISNVVGAPPLHYRNYDPAQGQITAWDKPDGGTAWIFEPRWQCSASKTYRIETRLRMYATSTSVHYLAVQFFDAFGSVIATYDGLGWASYGGYWYYGLIGQVAQNGVSVYTLQMGALSSVKIPANAAYCQCGILAAYASGDGTRWGWSGAQVREVVDGQTLNITQSNVSTYVGNGAFGWAQIGNLTINTTGAIKSGKTSYTDATVGYWIGFDAGVPKLVIGGGPGNRITLDPGAGVSQEIPQQNLVVTGTAQHFGLFAGDVESGGAAAYAQVALLTDGSCIGGDAWYKPVTAGIGSGYWVRVTRLSGSTPDNTTLGVWHPLSTARYLSLDAVSEVRRSEGLIEISTSSSGSPVVSTFSYSLSAESYSGSIP